MKTKLELAASYIEKCKGEIYENHIQECFLIWGEMYGDEFVQGVKNKLAQNKKAK